MESDSPAQYDFSEAIATPRGLTSRSTLNHRQRAALTGTTRNGAEAGHVQSFLDTIAKEMRFRGPRAVLPRLRNLNAHLDRLRGVLTLTAETPQYAPVWETPERNRRTVDEALTVAGANLRRAISGGNLPAAFKYLDMMRRAIDLASNEGRA